MMNDIVLPADFAILSVKYKWHSWNLTISFRILAFQIESMLLNLSKSESFRLSTTIFSQKEIGHIGMKIKISFNQNQNHF